MALGHDNDTVLEKSEEEVQCDEEEVEVVTWDGPNDPENPRNWTFRKKWMTMAIASSYAIMSTMSSSMLSPAVGKMSAELHIENSVVQSFTVSIYLLAWAFCPLILAPISEMYGRWPVLNGSMFLLLVFNVACGLAKTPAQILVFRFLAGCAGSCAPSIASSCMVDLFSQQERNSPMAMYNFGRFMGPVFAPIIAGFVVENMDWRWVLWVLSMITAAVTISGSLLYPESYPPAILAKKAKKQRKETGRHDLHTIFELKREPFKQRLEQALTRPMMIIFTQPTVFGLGLFMAVVFGLLYILLVDFPALWTEQYGFSLGVAGLMYIGLGVGYVIGLIVWTPCMQKSYLWLGSRNPNGHQPEYRLVLLPFAAVLLGAGLILYGQTAERQTHWFWPVSGTAIFAFATVCVFSSIQNYLVDAAVENWSASTIAASNVFRCLFAGTFPLFGPAMYDKLGYAWANTICGIIAFILGIPFPIIVYYYGPRLRAWEAERIVARETKGPPHRTARDIVT